jgi:hypothetical protein
VTDRNGPQEIWLRNHDGERWLDRPLITQRDFGDDLTIMLSARAFHPTGSRLRINETPTSQSGRCESGFP